MILIWYVLFGGGSCPDTKHAKGKNAIVKRHLVYFINLKIVPDSMFLSHTLLLCVIADLC